MRTITLGGLVCAAALMGCGPQAAPDTRAADEQAIRDMDAQWSKVASTNDLEGTMAFYTEDAVLLPPNMPTATGKTAIRAVWKGLLAPEVKVTWEVTKVEVARAGDLGYLTGLYTETSTDGKATVVDKGKIMEVLKKQADGKWKAVADTFSSDWPPPAATAPAPLKK